MYTPRPGKKISKPSNKPGKLTKSGKIYSNNLLDTDLTSGQSVVRRIK